MNATSNNIVLLRGNLGQDPEEKAGGCVELRMATQYGREENKKVEWHTIKVWGTLGQQCKQFLKKGRGVGIIGRLTYFKTSAALTEDGTSRVYAEIVADQVDFL